MKVPPYGSTLARRTAPQDAIRHHRGGSASSADPIERRFMNEFDAIIGYDATKEELVRIADTLKHVERYRAFGVTSPRGLILYGEPGTGKTLMANCLIKASGRPAFICRRTDADNAFIDKMKGVFEEAEQNAPSIVLLDDMDKFANSDYQHRDAAEFVAVQSCIDNMRGKEVFVLATANENIKNLPDSLLRPGRFDRQICVEVPKGEDAVRIITNYLANKPVDDSLDSELVSSILVGHSCATLETVVNEADIIATYAKCDRITTEHMIEASMRAVFHVPTECLYETDVVDLSSESTKSIVVWHEAGHAVMSELLVPGSIALVSAKSKSAKRNHSGFVVKDWQGTDNELRADLNNMLVGLGGRAAVDVVFGVYDPGAEDDIKRVFQKFAELLGKTCLHGFWLHSPSGGYFDTDDYDDASAITHQRQVAAESLMEHYYGKVKRTLIRNRAFLDKVATALAEQSYLTSKDVAELKRGVTLVVPDYL